MKLLTIDTSSNIGMVAVLQSEDQSRELVSMNMVSSSSSHSERLFEAVDRVLNDSATSMQDISKIIFSAGPGSFTGLRISFSAVKGFAMGANKEIVAVSTLKSLATNVSCFDCIKTALIADTKDDVFAYIVDQKNKVLLNECSIKIDDLCAKLRDISADIYCVGSGALLYSGKLESVLNVLVPKNKLMHTISPFGMAEIAEIAPLKDLNYIKASYAEVKAGL